MLTCGHVNLLISVLLIVHLSLLGQLSQRPMAQSHHRRNIPKKVRSDGNEPQSSQPLAASAAQTVAQLRAIKIDSYDLVADIPVAARPLLTTLKHQLRDLISESLNTMQPQDQLGAMQTQAHVLIAFKRSGVRVGDTPDEADDDSLPYIYGDIY